MEGILTENRETVGGTSYRGLSTRSEGMLKITQLKNENKFKDIVIKKQLEECDMDPCGIRNKKYLDRLINSLNPDDRFAIVMLDLDDFKWFNNTFGHLAGDKALKAMAHTVEVNISEEDTVTRFGGDEFAIVMMNVGINQRERIVERLEDIRKKISRIKIDPRKKKMKFTSSVGVAFSDGKSTPAEILEKADKALYKAKNNKMNGVVVAQHN